MALESRLSGTRPLSPPPISGLTWRALVASRACTVRSLVFIALGSLFGPQSRCSHRMGPEASCEALPKTSAAVVGFAMLQAQIANDTALAAQRLFALDDIKLSATGPVARLPASRRGALSQRLRCLRPSAEDAPRNLYDEELLNAALSAGRACATCGRQCALHVFDDVATGAEVAALVAHGRSVLAQTAAEEVAPASGHTPASAAGTREAGERVDFAESADLARGSTVGGGHLLGLRLAERLRRLTAETFDVPRARLRVTEHFMRRSAPGNDYLVHCDEAICDQFQYSSVLWLSDHGQHFDGGELAFYRNRSWRSLPWLLVEPAAGRAAVFSSGWENVHGIKPVERGERWAFVAVFALIAAAAPPPKAPPAPPRADAFFSACVRTASRNYTACRQDWAHFLDDDGSAASPRWPWRPPRPRRGRRRRA